MVLTSLTATGSAAGQGISLEERLRLLAEAYPSTVASIDGKEVVFKSGARLKVEDGQDKTHAEKLVGADIEDMLNQVYPIGRCYDGSSPAQNVDPGRIRNETFFRQVYGNCRRAVEKNLIVLAWFRSKLRVTRKHGVDAALSRVAKDLAELPAKYRRFFETSDGAYNWRTIAGTKRLSVRSFGAPVDLNTKLADYWRWGGGKPGKMPRYRNKIPQAVVEVFERHGFIWDGKWYHFDTMHFEYRPELIAIARLSEARGCQH